MFTVSFSNFQYQQHHCYQTICKLTRLPKSEMVAFRKSVPRGERSRLIIPKDTRFPVGTDRSGHLAPRPVNGKRLLAGRVGEIQYEHSPVSFLHLFRYSLCLVPCTAQQIGSGCPLLPRPTVVYKLMLRFSPHNFTLLRLTVLRRAKRSICILNKS